MAVAARPLTVKQARYVAGLVQRFTGPGALDDVSGGHWGIVRQAGTDAKRLVRNFGPLLHNEVQYDTSKGNYYGVSWLKNGNGFCPCTLNRTRFVVLSFLLLLLVSNTD